MNIKKKEEESFARRIIKNIFFGGLTGVISKIGALIFTIIIARNFFPREFGIYSLSLTIILSILVISDLGIGSTLIRYVAESIGRKRMKQARSRFWFLLKSKFLLSLFSSLILFFAAGLIASFFKKPELIVPLKIGSAYLFLESLRNLSSSIFVAFQKLNYSTITEIVFQILRIVLLFFSLYMFKSVEGIFIILSLSLLVSLLVSLKIVTNKYGFLLKGKREPVERRRLLKFSGFLALSSLTIMFFSNIDQLVLGYFVDLEFIGFYGAILTIIGGVLGLISMTGVLFPVFTQLNGKKLEKAFKKTFHYLSIIVFPMAIGLAFVILPLIRIIYGEGYAPQTYEFSLGITSVLLSLLILEASFSSMYKLLLDSKEKPKLPAMITLTTSIANLLLNIAFVYFLIKIHPSYGLIGASAATFISRYAGMVFLIIKAKKEVKIHPDFSSITRPFLISMAMLAYLFFFSYLIDLNIFTGIIMILTAAVFYFIMAFATRTISIEEIKGLINR